MTFGKWQLARLAAVVLGGAIACIPVDEGSSADARAAAKTDPATRGRVIRVPADQPTLAAAMAVAQAGDQVAVAPGVYRETLALKTGVRVVGGPSTIDATGLAHGITGDASVTCCAEVDRFAVSGATGSGIFVSGAGGVRLADVAVEGSGNIGVLLLGVADATLERVSSTGNAAGVRADDSRLALRESRIAGNGAAGVRVTGGSAVLQGNVVSGNGRAVRVTHGASVDARDNQLVDNRGEGFFVDAGDDAADQVRSLLRSTGNVVTGNATGLLVLGSDVASAGDRFDENRQGGIVPRFGAAVRARGGSASRNAGNGAWASDVVEFFFCGNPDCTIAAAVRAPVTLELQDMTIEENGVAGVGANAGGRISVRDSRVRGNGAATGASGVGLDSGFDYDLGDGVLHHEDIPGSMTVRESAVEDNGGPCAAVHGTSSLDLGTAAAPGENSCAGDAGGVVNGAASLLPVPAIGNWWGTADASAIAALMSGPVAFVPFLDAAP